MCPYGNHDVMWYNLRAIIGAKSGSHKSAFEGSQLYISNSKKWSITYRFKILFLSILSSLQQLLVFFQTPKMFLYLPPPPNSITPITFGFNTSSSFDSALHLSERILGMREETDLAGPIISSSQEWRKGWSVLHAIFLPNQKFYYKTAWMVLW